MATVIIEPDQRIATRIPVTLNESDTILARKLKHDLEKEQGIDLARADVVRLAIRFMAKARGIK